MAVIDSVANNDQKSSVVNIDDLLMLMWDKASLTKSEMEAVANFDMQFATRNLADSVEDIGCLINSDKQDNSISDPKSVSSLLFNISNQLRTIAAVQFIASEAQCMVKNPELF